MYKYQFLLNCKSIGKPFPAKGFEDATKIILNRYFKGYTPEVEMHCNINIVTITIPIPGRKKLTYIIEKTGLIVNK